MPDKAKWSAGYNPQVHGVHNLNVPMFAHRPDNPQPDGIARKEQCKHHRGEDRNKGAAQKNNFECCSDKNRGVKKHDPTKVGLVNLGRATRDHLLLMPTGDAKLENAQQPNGEQKREKSDNGYVHCSSKNSALKPGPKAAASA